MGIYQQWKKLVGYCQGSAILFDYCVHVQSQCDLMQAIPMIAWFHLIAWFVHPWVVPPGIWLIKPSHSGAHNLYVDPTSNHLQPHPFSSAVFLSQPQNHNLHPFSRLRTDNTVHYSTLSFWCRQFDTLIISTQAPLILATPLSFERQRGGSETRISTFSAPIEIEHMGQCDDPAMLGSGRKVLHLTNYI